MTPSIRPTSSLTSLRFLAAFLVLGFHFFSFEDSFSFLNVIFHRGHLGVDFFFILSGFVLGLRYKKDITLGTFKVKRFLSLRLIRIAPAYYLALLLGSVKLLKSLASSEFLKDSDNLTVFIISNLTFTQSLLPVMSLLENWNVPSWSLSVELFFYLSFPVLSLALIKSPRNTALVLTCLASSLMFFLLDYYLPENIQFLGHSTKVHWLNSFIFRLPQFLVGNLLAVMFINGRGESVKKMGLILSVVFVLFIFCAPLPMMFLKGGNPLIILSFAIFIYFTALNDKGSGVLNHPWLLLLGEASYVLYICQSPLKLYFQQFYTKVLGMTQTTGGLYAIYLSICIILSSLLIYKFFELPIVKFLRKRIS